VIYYSTNYSTFGKELDMKYKLFAFDLDGTFLRNDKSIPKENIEALFRLNEAGCEIVPASGRIFGGLPKKLRELPFLRWCIMANGAAIYDALEESVICREEIAPEYAIKVFDYLDTLPCIYDCYIDNRGYITRSMFDRAPEFIPDPGIMYLMRTLRKPVDDAKAYIRENGQPLQKLQAYFNIPAERERALRELNVLFPELSVSTSIIFNVEMTSVNGTKGMALKRLAGILNIPMNATAAIGDGANDLSMIASAGLGIAMTNGAPEVKALAKHITASNEDMGFAEAVDLMLRNEI